MSQDCLNTKRDTPFFTVCIPVYNVEKYLKECVDSVLQQSEQSYEVVLVDDGSTDGSGKICDDYSKIYSFIHTIHKKNEGLFLARYDAVKAARGIYLLFLDSDDFFYPGALQRIKRQIEKYHADMVFFDWNRVFSGNNTIRKTENYCANEIFEGENKKKIYIELSTETGINAIWCKCIRKDLYDLNIKRDAFVGVTQAEDKLASLGFVDKAERIVYLKEALYAYRDNNTSVTHSINLRNYKSIQFVHEYVYKYMDKWNLPQTAINKQNSQRVTFGINCIVSILAQGKYKNMEQNEYVEAVKYIGQDVDFQRAYRNAYANLSLYEKLAAKMILKRQCRLLKTYLYFINGIKSVSLKVRGGQIK